MEYRHTRFQGAIVDGSRLLLVQHHSLRSDHRYWVFPGGGIEPDESEVSCVVREMREETGLEVRVERLLATHVNPPNRGIYHLQKTFLCRAVSGDPTPGDEPEVDDYNITDIAWLDLSDTDAWFELLTGDEWLMPVLWDLRAELGFGSHRPPTVERLARTPALGVTLTTDAATEQIPALPPGITIRAAEHRDRDQWAALVARAHQTFLSDGLAESPPGSPDPSHFDHDVAAGAIAVAGYKEQLVGTIAASEEHPAEYRSVSWATRAPSLVINRLVVDPEHRRRGIGTELLRAAAMHAARQGYSACRLDLAPGNRGARACCAGAGYTETALTRIRSCERLCCEQKIAG